jgi:ribose transport system permease protein
VLFLIMLVIAATTSVLLNHTTFGRYMVATGANEVAALLNGMPTRRILLGSFAVGGLLAGGAGVLQVAAQGNGNPQVGSIPFILPALAAVFLGATTLKPGTYNVGGTLLGLFFLGAAVSGLAILGAQPWVTDVFNGAAVVVAVTLSAQFRRRRTGASELGT